jgi:aminoglycoside phosphotransferase (APT) family kinase protein
MDDLLWHPWRLIHGPTEMADCHVRLHTLPARGFPDADGPFLERHLHDIAAIIDGQALFGLRRGLDWLWHHRPPEPDVPRILHLDFHPVNLMVQGGNCQGVLDWAEADVGDRHADVATTLVLIWSAPVEMPRLWQRIGKLPAKWVLYRRYHAAYARQLSLDPERLQYYIAWATLRRLCRYGLWLRSGPWITGGKASSLRHLRPDRVAVLCRLFHKQTRVTGGSPWSAVS